MHSKQKQKQIIFSLTDDCSPAFVVSSSSEITTVADALFRFGVVRLKSKRPNAERFRSRNSVSLSLADESSSVLLTSRACGAESGTDGRGATTATGAAVLCGDGVELVVVMMRAAMPNNGPTVRHGCAVGDDVDIVFCVGWVG